MANQAFAIDGGDDAPIRSLKELEPQVTLELGKRYPFTISLFDPKEMRMALTFGTPVEKKV